MKRLMFIFVTALAAVSCTSLQHVDPYGTGTLHTLSVRTVYPDEFAEYRREGVAVSIEEVNTGNSYTAMTDSEGVAVCRLTGGIYRVSVSDMSGYRIFNGTTEGVRLTGDMECSVRLASSETGAIVFKEIYCGGCSKAPEEGSYQFDKYVILHNNSDRTQYLDGLCFGCADPYNSSSSNNVWISTDPETGATVFPDFVPVIQCVWQFGGSGTSFPLAPGEDAVLVVCGAIDHASQYPLSVNLNKEGYFVCYNNTYFTNTSYHPVPGDRIAADHYLDVVIKTGVANAYPFSINSPAAVIFRAEDTTIQEFVADPDNLMAKPGSSVDTVVKIPLDWVVDAVEVFNGSSSSNLKRLQPQLDAGYVTLSAIYRGHTLHRRLNEAASAEAGYEIYADTNNSSADFYERDVQSLHE